MDQFVLYAQIPLSRHNQVLQILTGIAGAQPTDLHERHIIYKPLKKPPPAPKKGARARVQQVAVHFQQLVRTKRQDDFGAVDARDDGVGAERPWMLRVEQFPDAGMTKYVARGVTESVADDVALFLDKSKYSPVASYISVGHCSVYKNVVSRLYQTLILPAGQIDPKDPLPPLNELQMLDPSGAFLLEVSVQVGDRTKSTPVEHATKELLDFKDLLKGAVDLRVPDRFGMDTRMKR